MLTPDFPTITQNTQSGDSERWRELLHQIDLVAITDEFMRRLKALPSYAESALPANEIRRTGKASFVALLMALETMEDDAEYLKDRDAISLDVGVSRARAGVPIEALMTAIRLDFSVIWEALTSIADKEDSQLLVQRTARVWEVVDGYAGATQRAYVAELAKMQAEAASMRQSYLATLFSEKTLTPVELTRIAEELGLDPETEYAVAVALWDHIPEFRVALANVPQGAKVFTYSLSDALVAFFPVEFRAGSSLQKLYLTLERLNCGLIGEGCTLERIPQVAAVATSLAKLIDLDESGAMTWKRGWARMARFELDRAGAPGLDEAEKALESCGITERRRLRESVMAYLETGSISHASEQLYCHRNTLMNRLKRFTDLTGIDPTIPAQAARLVVGWS